MVESHIAKPWTWRPDFKFIHGFSTVWRALNSELFINQLYYSFLKNVFGEKRNITNFVLLLKKMCTEVMLFVSLFQPHLTFPECRKPVHVHDLILSMTLEGRYYHSPFHRLANTSSKRRRNQPKVKITKCQILVQAF